MHSPGHPSGKSKLAPRPKQAIWDLVCKQCGSLNFYIHILFKPTMHKVDNSYLVTFLNKTPKSEWCMVRCGFQNGSQKDMHLREIKLYAQNSITILNPPIDTIKSKESIWTFNEHENVPFKNEEDDYIYTSSEDYEKSTYGLNFDLQTIYPVLIACFHILIDNDNHFKMVNHLPYCSIFSELMLFKSECQPGWIANSKL